MIRALMWKEVREQAGRWLLATILLAGLTSLLIHARLISIREVSATVLMIGGMVLSIVLIIAPLPSEKTRGTLDFLMAFPIDRKRVLFAKWLTGVLSIVGLYAACCLAGVITAAFVGLNAAWMLKTATPMCVSMLAYHSLFFMLAPRAKHELDAAMLAFFLAIIVLLSSVYVMADTTIVKWLGHLAPAAPTFVYFVNQFGPESANNSTPPTAAPVIISTVVTTVLWIVIPAAWLLGFPQRRRRR